MRVKDVAEMGGKLPRSGYTGSLSDARADEGNDLLLIAESSESVFIFRHPSLGLRNLGFGRDGGWVPSASFRGRQAFRRLGSLWLVAIRRFRHRHFAATNRRKRRVSEDVFAVNVADLGCSNSHNRLVETLDSGS